MHLGTILTTFSIGVTISTTVIKIAYNIELKYGETIRKELAYHASKLSFWIYSYTSKDINEDAIEFANKYYNLLYRDVFDVEAAAYASYDYANTKVADTNVDAYAKAFSHAYGYYVYTTNATNATNTYATGVAAVAARDAAKESYIDAYNYYVTNATSADAAKSAAFESSVNAINAADTATAVAENYVANIIANINIIGSNSDSNSSSGAEDVSWELY